MKKQAIDSEGSMDRISELPQPLLHDILCLLSQKVAIQTSVLSKSWRYLGSTRPKLVFRSQYFYGKKETLPSVVDKALQRYHDQKLSLQKFCLKFSGFDSESIPFLEKWIPVVILNMGVKTFKLSYIPKIGYFSLPRVLFKSETLQSLYLAGGFSIQTPIDNVILCKHLHKIFLAELYIEDETLKMILSSCHLIESFVVSRCRGLRNIKLDNQISLKSFDFDSYESLHEHNGTSIEINAPSVETVSIMFANCINLHKYLFPHLKSLYLEEIQLSSRLFDSFSSNFPCLEKLSLMWCHGFEQFQLSSRSIKNFEILYGGNNPLKAVIDAPSLVRFEYFGDDIPRSISFQATASEWKSKIDVRCDTTVDDPAASLWCLKLYDILKALSKSKISLRIRQTIERNGNIEAAAEEEEEEETYGGLCEPVVVERLALGLGKLQNPSSGFLRNLKRICLARKWASGGEKSEEETE